MEGVAIATPFWTENEHFVRKKAKMGTRKFSQPRDNGLLRGASTRESPIETALRESSKPPQPARKKDGEMEPRKGIPPRNGIFSSLFGPPNPRGVLRFERDPNKIAFREA